MKTIFVAVAAIAVIAVGSNMILNEAGFSSEEQRSGPAVRLD